MKQPELPVTVYAESTPNPATMKFVANKLLIENGETAEYTSSETATESALVSQLFGFPFVTGIFIAGNFISVTKNSMVEWMEVTPELREHIKEYLTHHTLFSKEGKRQATDSAKKKIVQPISRDILPGGQADPGSTYTETEKRIVGILEEYVRPAVEQDGGAIHFKSFENGTLTVVLRGSCSGCPSSAFTLKAGIQGLFQKILPEVKEVVSEEE